MLILISVFNQLLHYVSPPENLLRVYIFYALESVQSWLGETLKCFHHKIVHNFFTHFSHSPKFYLITDLGVWVKTGETESFCSGYLQFKWKNSLPPGLGSVILKLVAKIVLPSDCIPDPVLSCMEENSCIHVKPHLSQLDYAWSQQVLSTLWIARFGLSQSL